MSKIENKILLTIYEDLTNISRPLEGNGLPIDTERYWAAWQEKNPDINIYRVSIQKNGEVTVMCLGILSVDNGTEGKYSNLNALPDWLREKLAVLMMLDPTPHFGGAEDRGVEEVGRRIDPNTFWVYYDGDNELASRITEWQ
jgi:hypothetical protein